ncbi:FtsX-like permease family protein [Ningiella sp. W23]|uniref:FtsX-like permease family protein n=1 Tax=Ningiella sp. W23 TaxID=3023715 RepID=UPI0037576FFD
MTIFGFSFIRFVASRFRSSKQQDGYISFVSKSSTFGIGLGCAALILLLSVMNGFEQALKDNLLKVIPHAELISASADGIQARPAFFTEIEQDPRVEHVFALNKASGLLQKGSEIKAVELIGADTKYYDSKFSQHFDYALLNTTSDKSDGILLGRGVMQSLSLEVGDSVQVLLPKVTEDISFQTSIVKWLTVVGELNLGGEIDNFIGITSPQVLASLLSLDQGYTHYELGMIDPFDAHTVIRQYGWEFDQAVYMSDWTRTHGHLYQDIKLVRSVVYIVLILVIAVASFNIVSSLVMSVKEKSKEIAILKTMGATDAQIKQIFISKGLYSGVQGASVGSLLGCILGAYLPSIINGIEALFGIEILDAGIYFTSSIPSLLSINDVAITFVIAIIISVLATLYPASKAAQILPARYLH